jgi:hypothetical protein
LLMWRVLRTLLGPGRSTFRGAAVGVLVASLLVTLLMGVPLLAAWREPGATLNQAQLMAAAALLALAFAKILFATLVCGLPVWLLLRSRGGESGQAYLIAGAVAGLVAAAAFGHAFPVGYSTTHVLVLLVSGALGAVTALLFWLIARRRPER